MAGADVIEAAVGITLLLIVSYVVLGGITTAANTVSSAKKDMTLLQEERFNTDILVVYCMIWRPPTDPNALEFYIKNTGSTIIDPQELNMVIITDGSPSVVFIDRTGSGLPGTGTWEYLNEIGVSMNPVYPDDNFVAETYNIGQWDPGEILAGWIKTDAKPVEFHVFTRNGATGSLLVAPTW